MRPFFWNFTVFAATVLFPLLELRPFFSQFFLPRLGWTWFVPLLWPARHRPWRVHNGQLPPLSFSRVFFFVHQLAGFPPRGPSSFFFISSCKTALGRMSFHVAFFFFTISAPPPLELPLGLDQSLVAHLDQVGSLGFVLFFLTMHWCPPKFFFNWCPEAVF